ncbi:uncharacterized protein LOC8069083 isoform X4 [Sorghum bicolor]|uniref:uncharacterized protein LOC8069083 isoform X4 n=1 Tax=Sorghum bicolor TaxID=4558 RepID=UPI000B4237AC|nr:uncharacterized protein LOC8069083 isoform X4 [Sorghum bicolor]|eukprot:XP_021305379.1 uncharacterized protein LOC8069083 isoform X4 [Sorghum bicolor]
MNVHACRWCISSSGTIDGLGLFSGRKRGETRNKTGPSYLRNETLRSPEATRAATALTRAEATAGRREATVGQREATAAWRTATATLHPSPSCFSPVLENLRILSLQSPPNCCEMDRGQNRRDDVFRGRDPFAGFGSHRSLISGFFGGRDRFDDPFFTRPFGGQMMGEHGMFGPGPFGGQMMGEHDMFGPSPFGPMGGPFGDMGNHGFIEQAPPRGNSRRPVITEVDEDEGENAEHGNKQPNQDSYVQEPDDGSDGTEGGQVQLRRDLNSANSGGQPQARTFTYQSSSVTYGGINGAYYTASTTRRTGSDGITVEESKEADTTTKEATHRISRGIHDKGHSLTRKLNSDGKVDTTQTMHNLNEDELAGFEESWKGNAGHYLPGWNQNAGAPNSDNSGREKGKSKSVSFYLSDASGVATPTDTNSEMGNIGNSCSDKLTDENLSNSSQQMTEKHSVTEDQYSNDQDHEGEPLDHTVEQQPNSDVGEIASSMKLRCRKKLQKVGTPNHTVDDCFDEDCVEPSLAEEDNDSGDDYTTGNKRKARKKSRDGVEESQQQKVQKNKSKVSSRGRKRTLKDELAAKPEKKKLTHRIRQRTPKEIKTLLESEEIDPMKLSAAHLRLLQEARERVNPKEIPSGPSSNSRSFGLEDMDDLDYRDEEARFFDNDGTENHVQNTTKLNYQSYMNKPARGKWSKSDTDLFYEGIRQFGSDFAMIQQLLPDKTRHQVRQKFKSEEKKNPLLVHDAIFHRSGDNLYFKKVIKQLNIEDVVLPEINNAQKQDGTSSERGPGNENVLDDFNEEENSSNWSNEEHGGQMDDVQEEHDLGNGGDDDDLGDVFDWY